MKLLLVEFLDLWDRSPTWRNAIIAGLVGAIMVLFIGQGDTPSSSSKSSNQNSPSSNNNNSSTTNTTNQNIHQSNVTTTVTNSSSQNNASPSTGQGQSTANRIDPTWILTIENYGRSAETL